MSAIFKITMCICLGLSQSLWASPAIRYSGPLEITPSGAHKNGITGTMDVYFDREQLVKVVVKSEKPVFGKSEFDSKAQRILTAQAGGLFHLAIVFSLQGPPHRWFFVYLLKSADGGRSYEGVIHKAPGTLATIENSLSRGEMPASATVEGRGKLIGMSQLSPQ